MDWRERLRERESATHFVVEGKLAVDRLLESNYEVEKVIRIGTDLSRPEASKLLGFKFHRGHLAIARKPPVPDLSLFGENTLVILPEIADPGNLGTIIRNTAALGGAGVIVGKGASPYNAKAIRSSAGNLFRVPVRQSPDLIEDLRILASSRKIIGASLSPGSIPLKLVPDLAAPPVILLGPEDFGLSPEIEKLCHYLAHIPMSAGVDSLNVASASALFLDSFR